MWPSPCDRLSTPFLVTGLSDLGKDNFNADLHEWKQAVESGDLEKCRKFLSNANLPESDNPMEATAWENGLSLKEEDFLRWKRRRELWEVCDIAYMVSRPRQPTNAGELMLRRYDAAPRPYWLRDWQPDLGGFTKVYEYRKGEEVKKFSVAYVIRPRTKEANACLCFTLLSGVPNRRTRPISQYCSRV